jgi:hypothetical protein
MQKKKRVSGTFYGQLECPFSVQKIIPVNLQIHANVIEQYILDARNIFLYFESRTKSLKQLHIIVCFSVLSVSSSFTISTYFINEGTWKKFQEKNNIGYMYKQKVH